MVRVTQEWDVSARLGTTFDWSLIYDIESASICRYSNEIISEYITGQETLGC